MDTVTVNGKLYKKATVLAKQFRYTTDYIGQLCRNKKVDCQFVGRSWYVTEASLLAHKDTRYKEVRVDEKTIKSNHISVRDTSEISVRPRLLKTAQKAAPASHFASRLIPRESKYFTDETELLPVAVKPTPIIKPVIPAIVPVVLEAATKIKVKAENTHKKLDFTEMPAVALTGHLVVKEIVPDTTPSTPVVIPAAVSSKEPENAPQIKPSFEQKLAMDAPVPLATIAYTPVRVQQQAKPTSTRLLIPVAVFMSALFFVFVTVTANQIFVSKQVTTIRVIFDPKPVQNFFLNLL